MTNYAKKFTRKLKARFDQKQNEMEKLPAVMGDGAGGLLVPGQTSFIYCQVAGQIAVVYNNRVTNQIGLAVWVGRTAEEPNLFQVLSTRSATPAGLDSAFGGGYAPSSRYEWHAAGGGQDPLAVHLRAITFLRLGASSTANTASTLYAQLLRGYVHTSTGFISVPTQDINLFAQIPSTANKAALVLITINDSGAVVQTKGSEVDIDALTIADAPEPPAGTTFLCGAIRVYNGQTVIQDARTNTDFWDGRLSWTASASLSTVTTDGSLTGDGSTGNPLSASSGATTVTAAGTTTLTVSSFTMQEFTGTTTQICVLPVVTTLRLGHQFIIMNHSTGAVTVNSSGGNLVATVAAGNTLFVRCILITGTTAASWDADYVVQPTEYTGTGTGNFVRATSPTIVTPTIASFVNANHTHAAAGATGGVVDHVNLGSIGTNTHAQIDTHLASTANPHSTTAAQVGVVAETNATNVYAVSTSPGGASAWTGTFTAAGSSGVTIKYATVSGTAASMTPLATDQLAKIKLYNTTRSNYVLISNHVAGTITSTANYPANWANGDTLTIVSQTVSGGSVDWIDLEFSPAINKSSVFLYCIFASATIATNILRLHPYSTYGTGNIFALTANVASTNITVGVLQKVTSNTFSIAWSGTPTLVIIRQMGYIT